MNLHKRVSKPGIIISRNKINLTIVRFYEILNSQYCDNYLFDDVNRFLSFFFFSVKYLRLSELKSKYTHEKYSNEFKIFGSNI